MTPSFEKFMMQHKMKGSQKADGYSLDSFTGLNEHEKQAVFELLKKELPWSIEWLFFLDPEKALKIAKIKEKELRGNPYAHVFMLQQQIIKHSGDLTYQGHMIDDYPIYPERLKPLAIEAVSHTPTNENIVNFFKQIIITEANTDAVADASICLLDAKKIPNTTEMEEEIYNRLMKDLRSDNIKTKQQAFSEIEKIEKNIID